VRLHIYAVRVSRELFHPWGNSHPPFCIVQLWGFSNRPPVDGASTNKPLHWAPLGLTPWSKVETLKASRVLLGYIPKVQSGHQLDPPKFPSQGNFPDPHFSAGKVPKEVFRPAHLFPRAPSKGPGEPPIHEQGKSSTVYHQPFFSAKPGET